MLAKHLPPLTGDFWQLLQGGCCGHGRVPVLGISHRRLCRAGTWALGRGRSETQDKYLRCWWAAALRMQWAFGRVGCCRGYPLQEEALPGWHGGRGGQTGLSDSFSTLPRLQPPQRPTLPSFFVLFLFKTQPRAEARCRRQHATAVPTGSTRSRGTLNSSHSPKSLDCGLVV